MAHMLAGALEKAGRVVERRAVEEAHIRMSGEGIHIAKRDIVHARSRTAIVQELANVGAAAAHAFEPWLGEPPQPVQRPRKPEVDNRIAMNGAGEP